MSDATAHAPTSAYAPVPGRIPGLPINLSGQELVLAPLTYEGMQEFLALQNAAAGELNDMRAIFKRVAESLHISLRRNYPDMTVADVEGLLDVGNAQAAMDMLAEASRITDGRVGATMAAGRGVLP